MRRKIISIINILILILVVLLAILAFSDELDEGEADESKLQVIATIFPNYDFAKQIGGDKVEVKLLLNSGVESHTYEPTPKDMIQIENSDVFIYTGDEFEPWAENILDGTEGEFEVVDTSANIELINKEEFEHKYANSEIEEDEHEEHEDEHEEHEDESSYDSHIWLDPQNAVIMIDDILVSFCKIDPENADYYTQNANEYKEQILALDSKFEELIENSGNNEVAFAGEFSYSYFIERYGLKFVTVYNGCGEGEEPSISRVKSVIDYINEHDIPVVFYQELSEGTVAKMISDETTAEAMVLYTLHNADTKTDTYVSLMQKNYENLKVALEY